MQIYPSNLPLPSTLTVQPFPQVIQGDKNQPRSFRRITRSTASNAQIEFRFLEQDYQIFQDWYKTELLYGLRRFLLSLPSAAGYVPHTVRFVNPPKGALKGHGYWQVTAEIEIRERMFHTGPLLLLHFAQNPIIDSSDYARIVFSDAAIVSQEDSSFKYGHAGVFPEIGATDDQFLSVDTEGNWFSSPITVELWLYPTSVTNSPHIWQIGTGLMNRSALYINDGKLKFFNTETADYFETQAPIVNRWTHISIQYQYPIVILHVNGVLISEFHASITPPGGTFVIGSQPYTDPSSFIDFFKGKMGEFIITPCLKYGNRNFIPD